MGWEVLANGVKGNGRQSRLVLDHCQQEYLILKFPLQKIHDSDILDLSPTEFAKSSQRIIKDGTMGWRRNFSEEFSSTRGFCEESHVNEDMGVEGKFTGPDSTLELDHCQ